uniref:Eukaryotic translation initiation factor 4E binding protein 1 n=1 Tax=Sparus aurata TaxID=8175 RepID=A0A671X4B3_SPAAU
SQGCFGRVVTTCSRRGNFSADRLQDYSTTPGGTMFSTTPGGTRIIYDRKFLLQCRTSPLTRTPPKLPDIPGVTGHPYYGGLLEVSCNVAQHHYTRPAGAVRSNDSLNVKTLGNTNSNCCT